MRLPALPLSLALALSLLTLAPTPASAATYLETDNGRSFYGMDDSGNIVLNDLNPGTHCSPSAISCYETIDTATNTYTWTGLAPTLSWDYTKGTCVSPYPYAGPCSISDNGWTATISYSGLTENLYGALGSGAPVLLYSGGFGGVFAINGVGDVVFDDGIGDLWAEATITPEPTSLILLGTATLALGGGILLRRRQLA